MNQLIVVRNAIPEIESRTKKKNETTPNDKAEWQMEKGGDRIVVKNHLPNPRACRFKTVSKLLRMWKGAASFCLISKAAQIF
jgi:hypothetical protein